MAAKKAKRKPARKRRRPAGSPPENQEAIFASLRGGQPALYSDEVHPEGLVAFFRDRLREMTEAEKMGLALGDKSFRPFVEPPTIVGYANEIGVTRNVFYDWARKHPRFAAALEAARELELQAFVFGGSSGQWVPSVTIFMLKNLQGWSDRLEQRQAGPVVLRFDKQDENA